MLNNQLFDKTKCGENHWVTFFCLLGLFFIQIWVVIFWLQNNLFHALLWHLIISLLFPLTLWKLMPKKFQQSPSILLLLFLLCLLIPVISGLGLFLSLTLGLFHSKPFIKEVSNIAKINDLPKQILQKVQSSQYSGSLLSVLECSEIEDQRIRAVLSTKQMKDQDAIPILRVALLDPVDEVRLLAYSMLDKKQKIIDKLIHTELDQLKIRPSRRQNPLYRSLAEAYWELSFLGLVQGQAKKQVLKKSYEQIQQFIFFQRDNADIYFLRGKVTLALDEYQKSEFSFKKALVLGLPPAKAAPYQAELAFMMRRFDKVSQYFSQTDDIDNDCEIVAGMLQQWG